MPSPTDETGKQIEDLNRVLEISRALAATTDLDELLDLILRETLDLLDAERATLFLYDAASNELVAKLATGVDELRVPADKGICGEVVRTGQTLLVPDAYSDDRFNPDVDRKTGFRTRNILSLPLKDYEGALVGVVQVLNKRGVAFSDSDIDLAETLGAQAGVALQRASLIEHYLQKQEMERAMQIARDIQRSLLPESSPDLPGFDLAGLSDPADETGGDTFDFISLPDGRWALLVADATGHGIGAAIVIAETRAMLRASARLAGDEQPDVGHILRTVNALLAHDLTEGRFVTCFLGILEPATGTLSWASAGHGPMLFYHHSEDRFEEIHATDLPLGVLDDASYDETRCFALKPGDLAVITTDGIFEAANPAGEQFGIPRMMNQLLRDRDLPAGQMLANLRRAVTIHSVGLPQADDVTAVVLRRD